MINLGFIFGLFSNNQGGQGQGQGPEWPEFDSGSVPYVGCSEGFSPGFPVFLPSQKPAPELFRVTWVLNYIIFYKGFTSR